MNTVILRKENGRWNSFGLSTNVCWGVQSPVSNGHVHHSAPHSFLTPCPIATVFRSFLSGESTPTQTPCRPSWNSALATSTGKPGRPTEPLGVRMDRPTRRCSFGIACTTGAPAPPSLRVEINRRPQSLPTGDDHRSIQCPPTSSRSLQSVRGRKSRAGSSRRPGDGPHCHLPSQRQVRPLQPHRLLPRWLREPSR